MKARNIPIKFYEQPKGIVSVIIEGKILGKDRSDGKSAGVNASGHIPPGRWYSLVEAGRRAEERIKQYGLGM